MNGETRTSPYQGFTPFDERDAAYFFGREKDARLIAADLFAAPLSVLYGASGVGKSSVLRAGVLPLLRPRTDLLPVIFNTWQTEPTTPLKGLVLEEAFRTLQPHSAEYNAFRDEVLAKEYDPLAEFFAMCARHAKRRLMIILDQFEEYSLYHPEGGMFAEQFPAATAIGDLSVSFMISLREDALARLDRFEGKIPNLFDNRRRIDHLDGVAARDAIRKPLEKYAEDHPDEPRITADENLIAVVLDDVRANRIGFEGAGRGTEIAPASTSERIEAPYLQLVMTRLWNDARDRSDTVLRIKRFFDLGQAKQIVEDHLESVMSRLTGEERDAAASVFPYLVTPSGTKIAHTVRDLSLSAAVDRTLLTNMMAKLAYGMDRVLRSVAELPGQPDEPRYEIFHDRLAPAILSWQSRYAAEKEVRRAKREDVERRRGEKVLIASSEAREGIETGEPPYELLADLLREGKLTVIFGSAASTSGRPAGATWTPESPFPPNTWELTQLLAHECGFPEQESRRASPSEVASYYALEVGNAELRRRLHDIFSSEWTPAPIHRAIAAEAAKRPILIVTSTFDSLLEQALDDARAPYSIVANYNDPHSSAQVLRSGPDREWRSYSSENLLSDIAEMTLVYKLFGTFLGDASRQSTFFVTEEDEMALVKKFTEREYPPPNIRAALQWRHVVFLGMSLRSWTKRQIFLSEKRSLSGFAISHPMSRIDARRWNLARVKAYDRDLNEVAEKLSAALSR